MVTTKTKRFCEFLTDTRRGILVSCLLWIMGMNILLYAPSPPISLAQSIMIMPMVLLGFTLLFVGLMCFMLGAFNKLPP